MKSILSGNIIVLTSNEEWGDMWYSKHHYANELAKKNLVFFINPPEKWTAKSLFRFGKIKFEEVKPNLFVCRYANPFPSLGNKLILKINDYLVSQKIRKILNRYRFDDSKIVLFLFNVFALIHPEFLKPDYSIFYSVDWYQHENEYYIASEANKIFVTNEKMLSKLKKFEEKTTYIPHGIPNELFLMDKGYEADKIVFGGSIYERVNLDLLTKLAVGFPKCQFFLAGKVSFTERNDLVKWESLIARPNVRYLGILAFSKMIKFFADANVCLAPYMNHYNKSSEALGSLKIYQYLALGKKVLSIPLDEFMLDESKGMITMYESEDDAVEKFTALLNTVENSSITERRIAFAKKLAYPNLIRQMEESFDK